MKKTTKKLLAVGLSFSMVLSGLGFQASKAKAEENETIFISSAEELEKIGTDASYPLDGNYTLEEDILGITTPIGSKTNEFTGTFNGNGHSITLDFKNEKSQVEYMGLFVSANGATISDTIVKGSITSGYGWLAGLVVTAKNTTIERCGSEVSITQDGVNNQTNVAGIVANAEECVIKDCYNKGNISGSLKNTAGIVGQTKTKTEIANCYNLGNIETKAATSAKVGGVVGNGLVSSSNQSSMTNCYNAGTVSKTSDRATQVGAVLGYLYNPGFDVKDCFYLEGTCDTAIGFKQATDTTEILALDETGIKALAKLYGEPYTVDDSMNDGYPCLNWEIKEEDTTEEDTNTLKALAEELPSGVISPKFSKDKNIIAYIKGLIETKEAYQDKGIQVSIKSVENRFSDTATYIEEDGSINYFYANLFEGTKYRYYGQTDVVFELSLNKAKVDYAPRCINVYWDLGKAVKDVKTVRDSYDENSVLGENESLTAVEKDLQLPVYPEIIRDEKNETVKFVSVAYTSSDESVITIPTTAEWDRDFNNQYYKAKVNRKSEDKDVTITATFTFERYTMNSGEETITEVITKEIPVTVAAYDEVKEKTKELQSKVDTYQSKIRSFVDGSKVDFENVKEDLQLAIPKDLGLDGKEYSIEVKSDDEDTIKVNGYRTYTYRPLPGENSRLVPLTVVVTNKENEKITATTKINLEVKPLTEEEINERIQLMQEAKDSLFTLIKGENENADKVTSDLMYFYGIYKTEEGLRATTYVNKPDNAGIIKEIVNPEEMVPDYQRYFIVSDKTIVDDETLRITQPEYDKKVSVSMKLTDEIMGKYAEKYAEDETYGSKFAELSNNEVTIEFTVKGTIAEAAPTAVPTEAPTVAPTEAPTVAPTEAPTVAPTVTPTVAPTEAPTVAPTATPTVAPTVTPTVAPTEAPTVEPTIVPTVEPTKEPSEEQATIKVKKVSGISIVRKVTKAVISYKKTKGQVSGYQIQYSLKKDFKKKTSVNTKKLSYIVKKLNRKKQYFFRVRAFYRVDGKKVYGKWSKVLKK